MTITGEQVTNVGRQFEEQVQSYINFIKVAFPANEIPETIVERMKTFAQAAEALTMTVHATYFPPEPEDTSCKHPNIDWAELFSLGRRAASCLICNEDVQCPEDLWDALRSRNYGD